MVELTENQKQKILKEFEKDPSIINITRVVFDDNELDGRSKEGRSVIKFLAKNGLKIQTTKHEKAKEVNLNVDQVEKVIQMAEDGMNTSEISDVLFNKRVKRLSNEWRAVNTILSQKEDNIKDDNEDSIGSYVAPQALSRIIKKINDSTGYGLEENRMSRNQKHCCDKLRIT